MQLLVAHSVNGTKKSALSQITSSNFRQSEIESMSALESYQKSSSPSFRQSEVSSMDALADMTADVKELTVKTADKTDAEVMKSSLANLERIITSYTNFQTDQTLAMLDSVRKLNESMNDMVSVTREVSNHTERTARNVA